MPQTKEAVSNPCISILNIVDLTPHPQNPRTDPASDPDIPGLAQSIKNHGILCPILVRPLDKKFQILAGHRRYYAAKHLKMKQIPAIVRSETSDEEAAMLLTLENLQRKNLRPLEEAAAFALLRASGMTEEHIAKSAGISKTGVARRLLLNDMIQPLKDAATRADGDINLSDWTSLQLSRLAIFPPSTQQQIYDVFVKEYRSSPFISPRFLPHAAHSITRLLTTAPWGKNDFAYEEFGEGDTGRLCEKCPHRSDHIAELWDDLDGAAGMEGFCYDNSSGADSRCLNGTCWNLKTNAFVRQEFNRLQKKNPNLLMVSARYWGDDENFPSALSHPHFEVDRNGKNPNKVAAIWVDAETPGKFVWVVLNKKKKTAGKEAKFEDMPAELARLQEKAENAAKLKVIEEIATSIADVEFDDFGVLSVGTIYAFGRDRSKSIAELTSFLKAPPETRYRMLFAAAKGDIASFLARKVPPLPYDEALFFAQALAIPIPDLVIEETKRMTALETRIAAMNNALSQVKAKRSKTDTKGQEAVTEEPLADAEPPLESEIDADPPSKATKASAKTLKAPKEPKAPEKAAKAPKAKTERNRKAPAKASKASKG